MTGEWTMALLGGCLIGFAAALLMLLNGRVSGVSGILAGLVSPVSAETSWRIAFLLGMLLVGLSAHWLFPTTLAATPTLPLPLMGFAGILVGFGTRLGSGCTSGHGICGLSRGSVRSLVAVLSFMASGAVAVFLKKHL